MYSDNFSEISIETEKGETIVEYFANSIPRIEEWIEFENKTYRVYDVAHCLVIMGDNSIGTYAKVKVQKIDRKYS